MRIRVYSGGKPTVEAQTSGEKRRKSEANPEAQRARRILGCVDSGSTGCSATDFSEDSRFLWVTGLASFFLRFSVLVLASREKMVKNHDTK